MRYKYFLRRVYFWRLIFSFAVIVCFVISGQAQSALDGFDPNANDTVSVIVIQPDGKILMGGSFTALAPNGGVSVTRNRIARLNPDGTLDTSFNPNANDDVRSIVLQADGDILVGGEFTVVGGQTRNRVARLDAVTGLADSFNPNANGIVRSIIVQADGKILAGGEFTTIGGQTRNRIARLDAATGAADSFDPNANNIVFSIALQNDGKILVGGDFNGANSIGGQTRNRIARLDSATGAADSFDPNANGRVQAFAVQPDGKILVGGSNFTSIGGQTRNRIARLNPTTGSADSFNPNANLAVIALAIQPNGMILAGGTFASIGGQSRSQIARLDPATGLADSFNPSANQSVTSLAVQMDGKIVAGGAFSSIGGQTRNNIARLETDGRLDQTLDLGTVGNYVDATAVQPDGKILISGDFSSILGVARNRFARLNADGTLDTAFNPNPNSAIQSIVPQPDGKILVGGFFSVIGGQTRNRIARLDGVTGLPDSFDPDSNGVVRTISVQADGKILVGGANFTTIGGQARNRIARLDATTGLADTFNPNANGSVDTIALQADGKILAGGDFDVIGGQTRNNIARLDPTTGTADSFNPNASSVVYSIAVQVDGKILVGGGFTGIGGQTRNRIARLSPTTGTADSFDPNASSAVFSIALQANGNILVAGLFTSIGGQTRNNIARLNPTTGTADSFDPNANDAVFSIALQADGKILAAGEFDGANSIGGQPRSLFARLKNDTIAVQNLAVTQTAVTWTRGGSSPQFTRVTFEDSTDGVNYNFLGNGTPSGNNWTLTGLNLSTNQNLYIRARGFYRGGIHNASESIQEAVRNAFPVPAPTISGTVTYGNAAAPPRFISNATVTGTGSPNVFTTTAAPGGTAGQYTLTGFGSGFYTVSLSKTTGQNGISSSDAARIAQHVSGALLFTNNNQRVAADVTGNGVISSQDAAKVAQVVAGLPLALPNFTGQWRFYLPPGPTFPVGSSPTSRTYSSVTSSITGDDYVGLLIGETTGNWSNTGARPTGGSAAAPLYLRRSSASPVLSDQDSVAMPPAAEPQDTDRQASEKQSFSANRTAEPSGSDGPGRGITLEFPNVMTAAEKEIVVPVHVQGAANKEIISYEFDLRYDSAVIQPLVEAVNLAGTVSRGLSVVTNATEPGLLRVVVYGAFPIDSDGVLLNLRFVAVGKAGAVSPLAFERIFFNEGETPAAVIDGKVELF